MYFLSGSVSQECRSSLTEFYLRKAGAVSSESLPGAGGSTSKIAYSHSYYMELLIELLVCSPDMVIYVLRVGKTRQKAKMKLLGLLAPTLQGLTPSHLLYPIL